MNGKVLFFNDYRGYGKIIGEDGKTYYANYRKILNRKDKTLYKDEMVKFDSFIIKDKKEDQNDAAINIEPIDCCKDEIVIIENPFTPDRPVNDPFLFAGRKAKIIEAITCLENKKSILIEGDRGIGKSSFCNQIVYIASGDQTILEKHSINVKNRYDYACVCVKMNENDDVMEISDKIISEFVIKFGLNAQFLVEHEIDLKVYKAKIAATSQEEREYKIIQLFTSDLLKIYNALNRKSGILIFIDELENIKNNVGLASFTKNVSEYFVTEHLNILFLYSGIYSSSTKLFREHPSFYRLFTPIELIVFSPIEANELIDLYLYGRAKKISDRVKDEITEVSRGMPQNIQLIGYYCYQVDQDDSITVSDLRNAIDYIIKQIKKVEFQNRHEKIGYSLNEQVLKIIITNSLTDFRNEQLQKYFPESELAQISSSMGALCEIGLFMKYEKGSYYLKDALFFKYLIEYYRKN